MSRQKTEPRPGIDAQRDAAALPNPDVAQRDGVKPEPRFPPEPGLQQEPGTLLREVVLVLILSATAIVMSVGVIGLLRGPLNADLGVGPSSDPDDLSVVTGNLDNQRSPSNPTEPVAVVAGVEDELRVLRDDVVQVTSSLKREVRTAIEGLRAEQERQVDLLYDLREELARARTAQGDGAAESSNTGTPPPVPNARGSDLPGRTPEAEAAVSQGAPDHTNGDNSSPGTSPAPSVGVAQGSQGDAQTADLNGPMLDPAVAADLIPSAVSEVSAYLRRATFEPQHHAKLSYEVNRLLSVLGLTRAENQSLLSAVVDMNDFLVESIGALAKADPVAAQEALELVIKNGAVTKVRRRFPDYQRDAIQRAGLQLPEN